MKSWIAIILLSLSTSCRDGHFEKSRAFQSSDRLKVDLLEASAAECESSDIQKFCYEISLTLRFGDRVEGQRIQSQSLAYRFLDLEHNVLNAKKVTTDSDGQAIAAFSIEIYPEQSVDTARFFLEVQTKDFGKQMFSFNLIMDDQYSPVQKFERIETLGSQNSEKTISHQAVYELINKAIIARQDSDLVNEEIEVEMTHQLKDNISGQALGNRNLKILIHYYLEDRVEELELTPDDSGTFKTTHIFKRSKLENDFYERIDLQIDLNQELFPNRVRWVFVMELNSGENSEIVRNNFSYESLTDHGSWRDQAIQLASQESPEFVIDRLSSFFTSFDSQTSDAKASLQFELQIGLMKKTFSGTRRIALEGFKCDIDLYLVEMADDLKTATHLILEKRFSQIEIRNQGLITFQIPGDEILATTDGIIPDWVIIKISLADSAWVPPGLYLYSRTRSDIISLDRMPELND